MGMIKFILAVLATGFICAPVAIRAEAPPVVTGIRVVAAGDKLGVEISADKNLVYNCYKMPQLRKVFIDLPLTEPGRPDTLFKVNAQMIATIKLQKKTINDVMVTRLAVNLSEDADFTVAADPSDKRRITVFFHRPVPVLSTGVTPPPESVAPARPSEREEPAAPEPPAPKVPVKPAVPASGPAVTVSGVNVRADALEIQADGRINEFKAFILHDPERLVVDIPAATSKVRSIPVPVNRLGIVRARLGIFEGRLRLVFEAGRQQIPPYSVVSTDTGLKVVPSASSGGQTRQWAR
jgi:type IV pilus assembly protein PilQ